MIKTCCTANIAGERDQPLPSKAIAEAALSGLSNHGSCTIAGDPEDRIGEHAGDAEGLLSRSILLRSSSGHLRKSLDNVLNPPLPRLRRARLLESLDNDPPGGGRSALKLGGCSRTKLQCASKIGRE